MIPIIDLILVVFAIGAAGVTALMWQRYTLVTTIDEELRDQQRFWKTRADELCVEPPIAPNISIDRVFDVRARFVAMRGHRDRIWTGYESCMAEAVEDIPEALLRFSFNEWDKFDMTATEVEFAKSRIREFVDSNAESRRIFVRGHSDRIGTDEYNYPLSFRRAYYVGKIVVAHLNEQGLREGVDFELITEGMGPSRPVARIPGESDEWFDRRCRRIQLAFQRIKRPGAP